MSSTIGNAVYEELWIRELMAYANQSHILQTWEPVCYLDKGQFSRIFRIRHRKTGMPGALKFVPNPVELSDCDTEGSAKDEFHRSRFESSKFEAEIMSRFHGERNIVQYLETPEFLRRTFRNDRGEEVVHYAVLICMPLYRNSKDWLPLATEHPDVRIRLGLDITQALMRFEEKGVFHRDIKPGNIMLDSAGNFVLGDVGEAKLESDMTTMGFHGTRPYMAPEVLRLEMEHGKMRSDHRSDIYSLGIVLYRLYNRHQFPFLTGEGSLTEDASRSYTLYEKRTRSEGQILYLTDSERARRLRYDGLKLPPPSDADARLSQIILKACAYHRKDRYQSAAELYAALMEYINAPLSPSQPPADPSREKNIKRLFILIAALLVTIIFTCTLVLLQSDPSPVPPVEPVITAAATPLPPSQPPTPTPVPATPTPTPSPTPTPTPTPTPSPTP